jgi:Ca2+-binding EF-hand superfamily protein
MSKSAVKMTGRLAGFDPSAYANEFVTADEVLEIKRAFDLFDYDGGGSIDPKGRLSFI